MALAVRAGGGEIPPTYPLFLDEVKIRMPGFRKSGLWDLFLLRDIAII